MTTKSKPFVLIRTYSAGVFAGHLVSRKGKEATLTGAIRIWYWKGAASLSELAAYGPKSPLECKFGVPVDVILTEVIEVISTTAAGEKAIKAVQPWRA